MAGEGELTAAARRGPFVASRRPEEPPPPRPPGPSEPPLRAYWRILVRRRALVLGTAAVVAGATAIYATSRPRLYTASALLEIDKRSPRVVNVPEVISEDTYDFDAGRGSYYQTQYRILRGRSLATRVIRTLGLARDPRFLGGPPAPRRPAGELDRAQLSRLVDRYLGMLKIVPVESSRLVEVRVTSTDPQLAAEIANAHAEQYIEQSLEARFAVNEEAHRFLERKLAELRERLHAGERRLDKLRREEHIVSTNASQSLVGKRLADLNRRLTDAQAERMALEFRYRLARKGAYEGLPEVQGNPVIQHLRQERSRVEARIAELGRKFTPDYPAMVQLRSRLKDLKVQIAEAVQPIIAALKASYLAAKDREKRLAEELARQKERTLEYKARTTRYDIVSREVESTRRLYENLLQRIKETDITADLTFTNLMVVERAEVPFAPSSPATRRLLAYGLLIGLALGGALAALVEYLDDTLRTPADLAEGLGLATLGVVPDFALLGASNGGPSRAAKGLAARKGKHDARAKGGGGGAGTGLLGVLGLGQWLGYARGPVAGPIRKAMSRIGGLGGRVVAVAAGARSARGLIGVARRAAGWLRARGGRALLAIRMRGACAPAGSRGFAARPGDGGARATGASAAAGDQESPKARRGKRPRRGSRRHGTRGHRRDRQLPALIGSRGEHSLVAETYRTIRTSLLLSRAPAPPQAILMTSALKGEGKTLTTVNTSIALAQAGARVLVIDGDLRNPRCHRLLGVEGGAGLTELLTGQADLDQVVRPSPVPNLYVLPGGTTPPSPPDLIGSNLMHETLERLRRDFDFLLVDSPPALPVSDAALLGSMVDGVALVVRAFETRCHAVREAVARLEFVHARILGAVLNRVPPGRDGYYDYYYYCYAYGSYAREAEVAPAGEAGITPGGEAEGP